jgi:protein-S-isoprenylcysteine O-methyltransferase Ste14
MTLDPTLLRAVVLLVPAAASVALWLWRRPTGRQITGLCLATIWQLPPLLLLNAIAADVGWWRFSAEGGLLWGVPMDLLAGWMLLWGAIPAMAFPRLSPVAVAGGALLLDLLVIPLCRPVIDLSGRWLLGEVLCIVLALLPGLALSRWTVERRNLIGRSLLQAVGFTGLIIGVLPAVILSQTGGSLDILLSRPTWVIGLFAQVLFLFASIGLSAVQELAARGQGTPLPQDPTLRLVHSGPYAYLANPMQVSVTLLLAGLGLMLGSAPVAGAGLMVIVFSAGLADWHEGQVLQERFGALYGAWRQQVRPWLPRWRPWVPFQATLYYAEGCSPCEQVARLVSQRRPVGLRLVPAQDHPARDLTRLTYDPGDGSGEEEGVAALARALEHTHLGLAALGWLMRLPGLCGFLQVLVDASGGGPRLVRRRSLAEDAPEAGAIHEALAAADDIATYAEE